MEGTSERKDAAPAAIKPINEKKGISPMVLVVVAVVVILIIAVVAYVVMTRNAKENEGLKASVTPDALTVDAGKNATLEATATFDGDSIDDSVNATFSWTVSDNALGTLSSANLRTATFHAAKIGGSGTISCAVTYLSTEGTSTKEVNVSLVVNPPVLATVKVTPPVATLVFDRPVTFNLTAENSVGDEMTEIPDADITWTVWGLPSENCTLNSTHGASVNLTANASGTVSVNVTVVVNGVQKSVSIAVHVIRAAPTVVLSHSKLPAGAGINWTFNQVNGNLSWDELTIQLTDGTDTVNWSLSMEGLDSGAFNTSDFGNRTLGSLAVFLNITDAEGNGAVNTTDYFLFTTSGGKFNPAGNYVIRLIYEPTGIDVVSELAFNG